MDQTPYRPDKYNVTRTDGKPVGRTFVVEIDKDPDAVDLLISLSNVYLDKRPELCLSLRQLALELEK